MVYANVKKGFKWIEGFLLQKQLNQRHFEDKKSKLYLNGKTFFQTKWGKITIVGLQHRIPPNPVPV